MYNETWITPLVVLQRKIPLQNQNACSPLTTIIKDTSVRLTVHLELQTSTALLINGGCVFVKLSLSWEKKNL